MIIERRETTREERKWILNNRSFYSNLYNSSSPKFIWQNRPLWNLNSTIIVLAIIHRDKCLKIAVSRDSQLQRRGRASRLEQIVPTFLCIASPVLLRTSCSWTTGFQIVPSKPLLWSFLSYKNKYNPISKTQSTTKNYLKKIKTYYSLSVPSLIAISWYSWRVLAISSGTPKVLSWLAATREAKVSPGNVTTGVPVHRTSILVVWPLQRGVSKQTSASCPRLTCSSFAATLLNKIRPGASPNCWAVSCRFGSPTAGNRNSQITAFGTCLRICKSNFPN